MNTRTLLLSLPLFTLLSCNEAKKQTPAAATADTTDIRTTRNDTGQATRCVYSERFTMEEINKMFPFNEMNEVYLTSFPWDSDSLIYDYKWHRIEAFGHSCFELKKLDNIAIEDLKKLLYNHVPANFKDPGRAIVELWYACDQPRNTITFGNASGAKIAEIELCFHCRQTYTQPENLYWGEICNERFELLTAFFKKNGITYGVL